MKKHKIAGKTVGELDYYFFRYLRGKGKTIDEIVSQIALAILQGNGDYIIGLHKEYKFKDIAHMAALVLKAKPLVQKAARS